jgi:hypothetical protein
MPSGMRRRSARPRCHSPMRMSGRSPFWPAKAFATPRRVALSMSLITTLGTPRKAPGRNARRRRRPHRARLEPPRPQRPERLCLVRTITPHSSDHVEALAPAGAALDPQVDAVDHQHLRPGLGQQTRAQRLGEDIDPVGHQLTIPRRIAALGPGRSGARRAAGRPGGERRTPRRDRSRAAPPAPAPRRPREPRTDSAARRPGPPTPRPASSTQDRTRAAPPARAAGARQRRREAMRRITVGRLAPPALAPMRRLPIPATTDHHAARMSRIRAARHLHPPEQSPPAPTPDDPYPSESRGNTCSPIIRTESEAGEPGFEPGLEHPKCPVPPDTPLPNGVG